MNTGNYENYLIREANNELWPLDRTEATADWFDNTLACVPPDSEEDVRVFPASSESMPIDYEHFGSGATSYDTPERTSSGPISGEPDTNFGSESEPYTIEEINTRRKETNTCE